MRATWTLVQRPGTPRRAQLGADTHLLKVSRACVDNRIDTERPEAVLGTAEVPMVARGELYQPLRTVSAHLCVDYQHMRSPNNRRTRVGPKQRASIGRSSRRLHSEQPELDLGRLRQQTNLRPQAPQTSRRQFPPRRLPPASRVLSLR